MIIGSYEHLFDTVVAKQSDHADLKIWQMKI